MKSRSNELVSRAIAATVAAIEIYNKPNFPYREETFAILAINGWELLLKAKWLKDHNNNIQALYVKEPRKNKDGSNSQKQQIKKTRSGNPFTYGLDFLAKKLLETRDFDSIAWANIQVLTEIRNSSIHFYNRAGEIPVHIQEIGAASIKNFVITCKSWFNRDLSEFNFYIMPLSFIELPRQTGAVVLNPAEKKFLSFIERLKFNDDGVTSPYSITVKIDIKFTRSKTPGAHGVNVTNNPKAPEIRLTEEQIIERYPWDYRRLTVECQNRYTDFKVSNKYHTLRKQLIDNKKYGSVRFLDPNNPKSSRKPFFNSSIMCEFDKHYTKK